MSYGLYLNDSPSEHSPSTPVAALPSSAAFATAQDDFLLSLAPHKRSRALIDFPTYAAIRAVLLDVDLASSSKFCTWAHKTFCLDDAGEHILHETKRVARTDHLYDILCEAHVDCAHGGPDATLEEVRMHWRFVPEGLVDLFVRACPTCTGLKTSHGQAEHTGLRRPPVPVSAPVSAPLPGSVPVPVPRVLIFPASEVYPPADPPCPLGRSPNMPLGSSTTELLIGFTPPVMRAQCQADCEPSSSRPLGLRLKSRERYPETESSLKPCIDPALSPSPAPPPPPYKSSTLLAPCDLPSIVLDTTFLPASDPPPRPPRSPFRPRPTPISRTALPINRSLPPRPIDLRAVNGFRPLFYDIEIEVEDMATPAPAYTSDTPSELSLPSTPSSECIRDAEIGHRDYTSCDVGESTAYGAEYAITRENRILRGTKPDTTGVTRFTSGAQVNNGSDSPRSSHSIVSVWSQDSVKEEEYDGDVEGERDHWQDFL